MIRDRERGDEDQDGPHHCRPYKLNFDLPRLVVLSTTLALTLALQGLSYTYLAPGMPCRPSER